MQDWTVVSVNISWMDKTAEMKVLDGASVERVLLFENLRELSVDRTEPWGASSSVNEVKFVNALADSGFVVTFEMQSGGSIIVSACSCNLDGEKHSFPGQ